MITNKLEKQFFDTFRIKAHYKYLLIDKTSRCNNERLFNKTDFINFVKSGKDYLLLKVIKYYPRITDRILLELICIANQHKDYPMSTNIKNIQARTLRILIKTAKLMYKYYGPSGRYKKLVKRVCAIFKEVLK